MFLRFISFDLVHSSWERFRIFSSTMVFGRNIMSMTNVSCTKKIEPYSIRSNSKQSISIGCRQRSKLRPLQFNFLFSPNRNIMQRAVFSIIRQFTAILTVFYIYTTQQPYQCMVLSVYTINIGFGVRLIPGVYLCIHREQRKKTIYRKYARFYL